MPLIQLWRTGASGGAAAALRIPVKPGQNPGSPRRTTNFQQTNHPLAHGLGFSKARLSTTLAALHSLVPRTHFNMEGDDAGTTGALTAAGGRAVSHRVATPLIKH